MNPQNKLVCDPYCEVILYLFELILKHLLKSFLDSKEEKMASLIILSLVCKKFHLAVRNSMKALITTIDYRLSTKNTGVTNCAYIKDIDKYDVNDTLKRDRDGNFKTLQTIIDSLELENKKQECLPKTLSNISNVSYLNKNNHLKGTLFSVSHVQYIKIPHVVMANLQMLQDKQVRYIVNDTHFYLDDLMSEPMCFRLAIPWLVSSHPDGNVYATFSIRLPEPGVISPLILENKVGFGLVCRFNCINRRCHSNEYYTDIRRRFPKKTNVLAAPLNISITSGKYETYISIFVNYVFQILGDE